MYGTFTYIYLNHRVVYMFHMRFKGPFLGVFDIDIHHPFHLPRIITLHHHLEYFFGQKQPPWPKFFIPLKTNMTGWKITIFYRRYIWYIFKWLFFFQCHVSFRGCRPGPTFDPHGFEKNASICQIGWLETSTKQLRCSRISLPIAHSWKDIAKWVTLAGWWFWLEGPIFGWESLHTIPCYLTHTLTNHHLNFHHEKISTMRRDSWINMFPLWGWSIFRNPESGTIFMTHRPVPLNSIPRRWVNRYVTCVHLYNYIYVYILYCIYIYIYLHLQYM